LLKYGKRNKSRKQKSINSAIFRKADRARSKIFERILAEFCLLVKKTEIKEKAKFYLWLLARSAFRLLSDTENMTTNNK
jgi:hypothetical protein